VDAAVHKRILAATADDTLRTTVFDILREREWAAPYDGRMLRSDFLNRWHGREDELRAHLTDASFRAKTAVEELHGANVFAGENVGLIHEILPAATILQRIVDDAAKTLVELKPVGQSG
jgi:nitronate monooxygenase